MPSKSEEGSAPLWLWPNLLSLDAPLVAVLWQGFLAQGFSLPVRPAARLALGLTVWAIYLLDRLLDARRPESPDEPLRHRFYRRNWKPMAALLAAVLALDAVIAFFWLRPAILRDGFIALGGVLAYLAIVHTRSHSLRIPKEVAAAILFTAGTFLTAWAALPCLGLAWAALAFFILCLANIVAIEAWEWRELPSTPARPLARPAGRHMAHPCTRWLARNYLYWVPLAVIACVFLGHNQWYASIAVSAAACALLFWLGRRLSLEARRALVDGVLLSPLLFLMLK
jgi:hypothetical protein